MSDTDEKARPAKAGKAGKKGKGAAKGHVKAAAEKKAPAPAKQAIEKPAPRPEPPALGLGIRLERSPYDLSKPDEADPPRLRTDPRHPDQALTAFWVVSGEGEAATRIGRVFMVEYEDRGGWFYQAQAADAAKPGARPKNVGEPWNRLGLAVREAAAAWNG